MFLAAFGIFLRLLSLGYYRNELLYLDYKCLCRCLQDKKWIKKKLLCSSTYGLFFNVTWCARLVQKTSKTVCDWLANSRRPVVAFVESSATDRRMVADWLQTSRRSIGDSILFGDWAAISRRSVAYPCETECMVVCHSPCSLREH